MKLYGYWRSGASYRLRCALALKGLAYDYVPVNLAAGEQNEPAYRAVNPLGLVPTLETDAGARLTGSESIIEWLEETTPTPPLFPSDPLAKQKVRSFCHVIGATIQPHHNLRVLNALKDGLGADENAVKAWAAQWIAEGFEALEKRLEAEPNRGPFSFGSEPGAADCYLVPQIYSAARFGVDMNHFPLLKAVGDACAKEDPFKLAHPDAQADAQ
ncbi:MAG: maleylacetoacetate isomerase [Pseudomonadota bacterium]